MEDFRRKRKLDSVPVVTDLHRDTGTYLSKAREHLESGCRP